MLIVSRDVVRRFRAVLRRLVADGPSRMNGPTVLCHCGRDGLTLEAYQGDLAVRLYADRMGDSAGTLTVPADVLARIEGRTPTPVALDEPTPGHGRARWDDGGVPQTVDFSLPTLETVRPFPDEPRQLAPMSDTFRSALAEAVRTSAGSSMRYALDRLQLRGQTGELIASDSKQLLIQRGFDFPWPDDILVPRVPALLGNDLLIGGPIGIGRTATHIVLRGGPWLLALPIDTTGRFPTLDAVIPRASASTGRLQFDPQDVAAVLATVPKLPGSGDQHSPITVDLDQRPSIRARADAGGPVTELVLERSTVNGSPLRVVFDRMFLVRALGLGFTEIQVARPDKAVVCRDAKRIYVWIPLDASGALSEDPEAVRIRSTSALPPTALRPARTVPPTPRRVPTQPTPAAPVRTTTPARLGVADVIAEAATVRKLLRDASARLAGLVTAVKQQRRQSRSVQQAVQSLRQLQLDH